MTNKALRKLRETRGDGELVSALVGLLIIVTVFAVVITLLPVFTAAQKLNAYTSELARAVELTGDANILDAEAARLNDIYGFEPEVGCFAPFMGATKQIQLGDAFSVEASVVYSFRLSGLIDIPITLNARTVGRSERYFK